MTNLYGMTDELMGILQDEGYYDDHCSAMTKEGLHSKMDIIGQLAKRDREIDILKNKNLLLSTGVALVFKHEEDFIKTFKDTFEYADVDAIEGFWMSGTSCLVTYTTKGDTLVSTSFISTDVFIEWLGGKS